MRWLQIRYVISRAGKPVLLSATLLGACGGHAVTVGGVDARTALAGPDAEPDVQQVTIPLAPVEPVSDTRPYVEPPKPVVPTPDDGTLAGLPNGCLDLSTVDAGVGNARAARVTMEWINDAAGRRASGTRGRIQIAPEIAGLVVGLPTVDLIEKSPDDAATPVISNIRGDGSSFVFDVAWPSESPDSVCWRNRDPSWTFRTTLRLRCGSQERTAQASTTVALCGVGGQSWASSGDPYTECATVCEMAPSPLVPATENDDLPLSAALRVNVRALVRAGDAVVLLADHPAKADLAHAWHVSAGTIECLDEDVVLWHLPASTEGPQLAQVAVTGRDLAAVASFRWTGQAA
jgi:hypothetical protein